MARHFVRTSKGSLFYESESYKFKIRGIRKVSEELAVSQCDIFPINSVVLRITSFVQRDLKAQLSGRLDAMLYIVIQMYTLS